MSGRIMGVRITQLAEGSGRQAGEGHRSGVCGGLSFLPAAGQVLSFIFHSITGSIQFLNSRTGRGQNCIQARVRRRQNIVLLPSKQAWVNVLGIAGSKYVGIVMAYKEGRQSHGHNWYRHRHGMKNYKHRNGSGTGRRTARPAKASFFQWQAGTIPL